MTPEEKVERVLEELQTVFRRAGHGSVKRTASAINRYASYFGDQRRRKKMDLLILFRTLDALGIDDLSFFVSVLHDGRYPRYFEGEEVADSDTSRLLCRLEAEWEEWEEEEKKRADERRDPPPGSAAE